MPFKKGHKINLGKLCKKETRDKIGKANSGENNGMFGKTAWNKGISPSLKVRKKISEHSRHFQTEETKIKLREVNKGRDISYLHSSFEKHPCWKGDDAGISAIHKWVYRKLGQPDTCEHCGKSGLRGSKINWANKDHTYKRNLTDWLRLCIKCHRKYDILKNQFIDNYVK